ncbi:hypothetical protein BDV11DRAFT_199300 [Aspergillus similis]
MFTLDNILKRAQGRQINSTTAPPPTAKAQKHHDHCWPCPGRGCKASSDGAPLISAARRQHDHYYME